MLNGCTQCLTKQQKIDKLQEEITSLKAKLKYRKRKEKEGFFGSSTPSSQVPVKPNTQKKASKKKGPKNGHKGNSRPKPDVNKADAVIDVPSDFDGQCPDCTEALSTKQIRQRRVKDCTPSKSKEIVYQVPIERCKHCKKTFHTKTPGVLPKSSLGNQLLANACEMLYLHGIPMGRVCAHLDIEPGALIKNLHRIAKFAKDVPAKLIEVYQASAVKHADETSWRHHGKNGYAWLFGNAHMSLFLFRKTRSSAVVREVLGTEAGKKFPGVLVVDRYAGYNRSPCEIQYCYAHLLREVTDLEKEFGNDKEVRTFVSTVSPLLALAMGLRNQAIDDKTYYKKAAALKKDIQAAMEQSAKHQGIGRIQNIFMENGHRLYHWVTNRLVPAENNLAERDLRPTVIARKTSYGSVSDDGAHTRGVLMSVLHTLKKQGKDAAKELKRFLDHVIVEPTTNASKFLFENLHPT